MKYLLYYLLFINTLSFLFYGIDKYKSIHKIKIATDDYKKAYDKLINSIKGIFHSNKTGVTENFYDMVQRESDETQEQMKDNSQTIDSKLANVVKELESIQNSISGDTTQSISNTRNITNAINNIKLITN